MKKFSGIDLHSDNSLVVVSDEQDRIVYQRRLANDLAGIVQALEPHRAELIGVVVEATYNWYWLVDGLMEAGYWVHLVNTKRTRLVQSRTAQILAIENILARQTGARMKSQEIKRLTAEGVQALGFSADVTLALQADVAVMHTLESQITVLEERLQERVRLHEDYALLTTVPGIGKTLATTIMLETGSIGRFAKVGNFSSYCRCVDSLRESNGKKKGEGNAKNGNQYLAWAFVEAAHFALRYCPQAKRFYERKKQQRNAIVATKALAHELARACYHMLREHKPFEVQRCFA
jgi:transposase